MEGREAISLPHFDSGCREICAAISAGHGLYPLAVSRWIPGHPALRTDVGRRPWLFVDRVDLRGHFLPAAAGDRIWRQRDLSDDQSDEGELLGGAYDDGLRAGRFSDGEAVQGRAAESGHAVGAARTLDRTVRQFPPAQFVS